MGMLLDMVLSMINRHHHLLNQQTLRRFNMIKATQAPVCSIGVHMARPRPAISACLLRSVLCSRGNAFAVSSKDYHALPAETWPE